jgi:fluoroquinolone resistance protein
VTGGDWSYVGLPGADLRKAVFEGVRMREADLTAARLEGATVVRVDLSGAMMHNAKLAGADLRGSDLSSLDPLTVDIGGVEDRPGAGRRHSRSAGVRRELTPVAAVSRAPLV